MSQELASKVFDDLKERIEWEKRQEIWARMRHDGLRRTSPPWPNAADMHFPLGDTFVERHKPFYVQQLRSSDQLAQFKPMDAEASAFSSRCAEWFDYKLKCRSNFQEEMLYTIDGFLELGKNVLAVRWDADTERLDFEAIDPIYCIVPYGTETLQKADRFTQVRSISVEGYKRRDDFNQQILENIKGTTAGGQTGNVEQFTEDRYRRAGITYSDRKDTIIYWETYVQEKNDDGKTVWMIHTYSPKAPTTPIKPAYELTYNHGRLPFVAYQYEFKDRGWYDNRGLVELGAPFETAITKHWNDQLDYMTIVNRPLLYSDSPIPNTANLRWQPGQILPYKVAPVQFQQPPISFDTQINFTRSVAEYRVAMPDYGIGNAQNTNDARTATEVAAIGAVSNQNVDLRSFVFRQSNTEAFLQAWELLKQYDSASLQYLVEDDLRQLPPEALTAALEVEPSGTADGSTKEKKIQQAWGRFQIFKDNPFINQGELVKSVLENDQEGLVRRLYQDPAQFAQNEYENESILIPALKEGAPITPKIQEDQDARLRALSDYIQMQAQSGQSITPLAGMSIGNRMKGHLELLSKKNPLSAKQWENTITTILQQIAMPQPLPNASAA